MSERFYTLSTGISRWIGPWFFQVSAGFVAGGYFLFFPKRVIAGLDFYRALYPNRGRFFHLFCVWKQYQNFTTVFLDRFLLRQTGHIQYTSEGWNYLEEAIDHKTGGIILMSHMGNWEVAAHLLKQKRRDLPLLLLMGARRKEEIEGLQKKNLAEDGIGVLAAEENGASPLDIIEAVRLLRAGGIVSLSGDRIRQPSQRVIPVNFLGRKAHVPEMPHMLALASGAPLFVLFAFRTGRSSYAFSVTPPIWVHAPSRSERIRAVADSAQNYASLLEKRLGQYPFQWYHFTPFLY
jgi:lauroyl/myristoyl acyltransferase